MKHRKVTCTASMSKCKTVSLFTVHQKSFAAGFRHGPNAISQTEETLTIDLRWSISSLISLFLTNRMFNSLLYPLLDAYLI
jgi:hypothetical protein